MATSTRTLTPPPSSPPSARFTLELEFVLSLANPYYLSHLAVTYPYLLNEPDSTNSTTSSTDTDTDATRFTNYLAYLHSYWRKPEYSKYLTHPGAVLRSLELLQQERFRREIIRPDVIARLLEGRTSTESGDKGEDAINGGVSVGEEKADNGKGEGVEMDVAAG